MTSPKEFEDEVRRVARSLWPTASEGGAEMVVGREVDGLFYTDEVVHMVEATMDRTVQKAHHDGPKLRDHLVRHRTRGQRFAKSWFVTFDEPTAHQREAIHKYDKAIVVISLEQFRSKLVDGRKYLELREKYGWGSAANPGGGKGSLPKYVQMQLGTLMESRKKSMRNRASGVAAPGGLKSIDDVVDALEAGARIALVGDYGAGKSMTTREIHRRLSDRYLKKKSHRFPVTLNLRHHFGQDDPDEALDRHASKVAFERRHEIFAAWRAGYVILLLDGFDEMAAPGWSGDLDRLRENRRIATALVKQFSSDCPDGSSILVAGRRYYFDSLDELTEALFGSEESTVLGLSDFTTSQSEEFLKSFGVSTHALPAWLPTRPLLLGYLAAEGLIDEVSDEAVLMLSAGAGWDWLLDRVCERESFIKRGMDGASVRAVIERIASIARTTVSGIGPVSVYEMVEAFAAVRRQRPSDEDLAMLQRLPGLGSTEDNAEEGTRRFIDADFASAAQAGDIVSFIIDPFEAPRADDQRFDRTEHGVRAGWTSSLEPLGIEVAAYCLPEYVSSGMVRTALMQSVSRGLDTLAADIFRVALLRGSAVFESDDKKGVIIAEVVVPQFDFSEAEEGISWAPVTLSQCLISEIVLPDRSQSARMPSFNDCMITTVVGSLGPADLPEGMFDENCVYEDFPDGGDRNAAILDSSSLSMGTRVVMTLLRKLYMQRGSGRRDSALSRGMSSKEAQLVRPAMRLLEREGLAAAARLGNSIVWLPDRSAAARVNRYLASPRVGSDSLVLAAQSLNT